MEKQVYSFTNNALNNHPIAMIEEFGPNDNKTDVRNLPPVFTNITSSSLWPDADIVFFGAESNIAANNIRTDALPLLVARELPHHRSVVLFAKGLWRWSLMMSGIGKDESVYRHFIGNIVRWLATREERKHFIVTTDKEFYHSGEMALFEAQLYSHDFQTIDGAEVILRLKGPQGIQEKTMIGKGSGKYSTELLIVKQGQYTFEAFASKNERRLYTDQGGFSADNWNLEFINTAARAEELKSLADATGGETVHGDDFSPVLSELDLQPRSTEEYREWQLWNKPFFLLLIIILLVIEWYIRKRKGMV
jgi:hypothetical protein